MVVKTYRRILFSLLVNAFALFLGWWLFSLIAWHPLVDLLCVLLVIVTFLWIFAQVTGVSCFFVFSGLFIIATVMMNVKIYNFSTYLLIGLLMVWGAVQTVFALIVPPALPHPRKKLIVHAFFNYYFPALIMYFLVLAPLHYFSIAGSVPLNLSTVFALLIAAGGLVIVIICSIRKIRSEPGHQRGGLWAWSRHPAIFGEICFWWGVFLMMLSLDMSMWVLFLGPLLHFLYFVWYYLPRLEEKYLKEVPGYQQYQEKTNLLLVLPKEKSH